MNIPVRRPVQGRSPEPTSTGRRKCMNRSSLTPEQDWLLASNLTNSGAGSDTLLGKVTDKRDFQKYAVLKFS